MRFNPRLLALAILLWITSGAVCSGQTTVLERAYQNGSKIKIVSLFGQEVKSGIRPYIIEARNASTRPITWTIRFDCTNSTNLYRFESSVRIVVPPGSEVMESYLLPVPPTGRKRYSIYHNTQITASAPGLPGETRRNSTAVDFDWPSIAISKTLALGNLTKLAREKEEKKKGREYFAGTYSELPTSWKGLTCLDILMMDEATWRSLPAAQKQAAITWIRFGGRMEMFTTKPDNSGASAVGLPEPDRQGGAAAYYSMGSVRLRKWDGTTLPLKLVSDYSRRTQFDHLVEDDFGPPWKMVSAFGVKDFNPLLVLILLIVFAIVVGPVNLFHFAKTGQRHRLFVTTPIISLVASLVIVLIILFQDGLGGNGRRVAFVDIQSTPGARQYQVIQHQLSRTGVMLQPGFRNESLPLVTPVKIPESRWNPLSRRNARVGLQYLGPDYAGDFFRSRNEQGFHLRQVAPTRSRLELGTPSSRGRPVVVSNLEFSVTDLFYASPDDTLWKSSPGQAIAPGESVELAPATLDEMTTWLEGQTANFGETEAELIRSLTTQKNRFFALATDAENLMIATHPAIRWEEDLALVSGIATSSR